MISEFVDSIEALPGERLVFWVITHGTKDFGDQYVLRRQTPGKGVLYVEREPVAVADDLEAARVHLPQGLARIDRSEKDDPVIVESWI